MIPKIIHQIWVGGKPLPDEYACYAETWKRHFPDWEYRLWTDNDDYSWMRNEEGFRTASTLSGRSDWLRHELMVEFGGMYIDTDFECLRNFESLIANVPAWSASESAGVISVGIMGAEQGHPAFRYAVEHLPEWVAANPKANPALQTGPGFFTALIARYHRNGGPRLKVYGPDLFYPYSYYEKHRKGEAFPNAVAVHHWAASWMPQSTTPTTKRGECIHLGAALPGQSCACPGKLRRCDLHTQCTTGIPVNGVMCCVSCPDREVES